MKKTKRLPLWIFAALFALVLALFCGIAAGSGNTASAASSAYLFSVAKYDIEYDVKSDCSINVTENITISYEGYASTGFLRDIPVNDGAQVRNVHVEKYTSNSFDSATESVWYDVDIEDSRFITVDIGDSSNKHGKSESYKLTYVYNITNKVVNSGTLPLNPVGHGWECTVSDVSVTIKLPEGFKEVSESYIGSTGSTTPFTDYQTEVIDGKTIISAQIERLNAFSGVTFYIDFEQGAIKNYTDFTPYWFVIAGAVLLVIIIAAKFLCFNKNTLTPVVNFEAPNQMDPLMMGKLIDNKINSEDVTAMIFYFADKGWLKINLNNTSPTLIRIVQRLPDYCSDYEKLMFANLFGNEDVIMTKSLTNKFYKTVERMTAMVNSKTKGLYSSVSLGVSILFALLGGLLMGLAPLIISITQISSKFFIIAPFLTLLPGLFVYALSETIKYNSLKWKKTTKIIFGVIIAGISLVVMGVYMLFVPTSVIGLLPKALICLISFACIAVSVLIISRTRSYTDKLNQIVGFKNFILLAEKDRLEKLLEDDPQFYYHVLPYAQVLGVSDKWEEKFKDITVAPPSWETSSMTGKILEFHMINRLINSSMSKMSSNFVSRPSSSGSNGGGRGFGGGHGGGFSGGGFGGGGGRGR